MLQGRSPPGGSAEYWMQTRADPNALRQTVISPSGARPKASKQIAQAVQEAVDLKEEEEEEEEGAEESLGDLWGAPVEPEPEPEPEPKLEPELELEPGGSELKAQLSTGSSLHSILHPIAVVSPEAKDGDEPAASPEPDEEGGQQGADVCDGKPHDRCWRLGCAFAQEQPARR